MIPDYLTLAEHGLRISESTDPERFAREARRVLPHLSRAVLSLLAQLPKPATVNLPKIDQPLPRTGQKKRLRLVAPHPDQNEAPA